jgi:hypothetical protein
MDDWRDNLVTDAPEVARIPRECRRIVVLGITRSVAGDGHRGAAA